LSVFGQANTLARPAATAEQTVKIKTNNGTFVGTPEMPDGDVARVILLRHSFAGTGDELRIPGTGEGIFRELR
jgi:hypothetical protein